MVKAEKSIACGFNHRERGQRFEKLKGTRMHAD